VLQLLAKMVQKRDHETLVPAASRFMVNWKSWQRYNKYIWMPAKRFPLMSSHRYSHL